jgi:F420H(2)-dependent quinone reductase
LSRPRFHGDRGLDHRLRRFPSRPPAWLYNLRANPDVEIQIARERRKGTAKVVEATDPEYDRLWSVVNKNNRDRYSAYQKQTARAIPVIVVTPT